MRVGIRNSIVFARFNTRTPETASLHPRAPLQQHPQRQRQQPQQPWQSVFHSLKDHCLDQWCRTRKNHHWLKCWKGIHRQLPVQLQASREVLGSRDGKPPGSLEILLTGRSVGRETFRQHRSYGCRHHCNRCCNFKQPQQLRNA